MQKIDLSKTDTSKFLYDPNSENFISSVEKDVPELLKWDEHNIKIPKILFLRFLSVMYDVASPLNRVYQSTSFMTRKLYSCQAAGFEFDKNGYIKDKEMEDYLVGKSEYLSDVTVKYIRQFGRPEWMYVIAYTAILDDYTKQSLSGSVNKNVPDVIDTVTKRIQEKNSALLFTGGDEESLTLRKALYKEIEKDRSILTNEKVNEHITSEDLELTDLLNNPYGDYLPNKMEYL